MKFPIRKDITSPKMMNMQMAKRSREMIVPSLLLKSMIHGESLKFQAKR